MASEDLPAWVALPEDPAAPSRKAFFEVQRPGVPSPSGEKVGLGSKAALVFGRNPDTADVLLEHPSISRRHAAVIQDRKGALFLYDFGSTHGTFLDGKKVVGRTATPLHHGSRVKFAESSRTYLLRMPAPKVAAAAEEEEVELDAEAMQQLPLSFGGSKKVGVAGALSKDAMAEGIAAMMKEIEASEKKRGEAEANPDPQAEEEEDDDGDDFGPTPKAKAPKRHAPHDEEEEEQDEEEEAQETPAALAKRYQVPMSHEVSLRGHHKQITCLAMDPAGARVAVGGMDYKILLYDFGGMDRTHKAFREWEPEDGNAVVAVSWSTTGDRLVCATGSTQAKVYDRDGQQLAVCVKGDPYIADMAHTKGHTMSLTAAQWHPLEKETVMTASLDGTVRLWDLKGPTSFDQLLCKRVIKARSQRSTKVSVTCATFAPVADHVAAGCQDGSVQLFSLRKTSWIKPDILMRPAHVNDSHVTAVAFAPDGKTLASRGTDDTVRLWDIRKPKEPLKTLENIATFYDSSNVAFSPDGRFLCCGTNVPPKQEGATGTLKFFEVGTPSTEAVLTMGVASEASVTHLTWHPRLKQLVCGTSMGATKVLYDPAFSVKGALMSSNRVPRKGDPMDSALENGGVGKIMNPSALPMYRDPGFVSKAKRAKQDRADPIKSKMPERPMNGPGLQGRVSGMTNFTQYVMQNKTKTDILEEDPREAILKYAEKAKEGTQLVGRAYAKTAPKPTFQSKTLEQEVEDMKEMEQEILRK